MDPDLNASGGAGIINNSFIFNDGNSVTLALQGGVNTSATEEPKTPGFPKSLITCRKSIQSVKTTHDHTCLKSKVSTTFFVILHCHGLAGTGKSTTLCRLAEEFPYFDSQYVVKWHIECDDQTQDLKTELIRMVTQMSQKNLLMKKLDKETLSDEADRNVMTTLATVLCEDVIEDVPILIVVEDIRKRDGKYFCDFLNTLDKKKKDDARIHVYIATRHQNIQGNDGIKRIEGFLSQKIEGFSKKEGQEYLMDSDDETTEENTAAAKKIVDWFSMSPLGLRTAKALCKSVGHNYVEYLELLDDDVQFLANKESKRLKENEGDAAVHIYQAITLPFVQNCDKLLEWKILSCLAYLHHIKIPNFVIYSLCQRFRPLPLTGLQKPKNKLECQEFISMMRENGLCTSEDSDSDDDENTAIPEYTSFSCHELVLHSFKMRPCQEINPLERTIYTLASLSTKDTRNRQIEIGMIKLLPHMFSVLEHCYKLEEEERSVFSSKALQSSGDIAADSNDAIIDTMVLTHLYEVFGAAQFSSAIFSERRFDYLSLALEKIWNIVQDLSDCEDQQDIEFDESMENSETEEFARKVSQLCLKAGVAMERRQKGSITRYESVVTVLKQEKELDFLEKNSKNKKKFKILRAKILDSGSLDVEKIKALRTLGVYLDEETHSKIFFAERIVMILHSMSRVPLCGQVLKTSEEYKRYKWYSKLAYEIAVASKTEKVTLLGEYLSKVGGFIPLALKCKTKEGIEMKDLRSAKELCLKVIEQNKALDKGKNRVYEHGFLKEQSNTTATMQVLRYLVRLNGRLYALDKDEENFVSDSSNLCEELMEMAQANSTVVMSSNCMIFCGKYYAASGRFPEAIKCFESYYECYKSHKKPSEWSWATLNYARAVNAGKMTELMEHALAKCTQVFKFKVAIKPHVLELLEREREKLSFNKE